MTPPVSDKGPGWYPDPWSDRHYRYWDGLTWTGHTFPARALETRPTDPTGRVSDPPPSLSTEEPHPPPPGWWGPEPAPTADTTSLPTFESLPPQAAPSTHSFARRFIALFVAIGVLIGFVAVVGTRLATRNRSASPTPRATSPFGTTPSTGSTLPSGTSPNPSSSLLSGLVITQRDVRPNIGVELLPSGNEVTGQATLDLCNATYPSESLRASRLQVVAVDDTGNAAISTEAVQYSSPAATAQAFLELKSSAKACPSTPVPSPVGEPAATTRFNPAPDGAWPTVDKVERQAYDFVSTDASGTPQHSVAVYLRRGNVLLGLYFAQPDGPQISVDGKTTIPEIVAIFENRMAQLPSSVGG